MQADAEVDREMWIKVISHVAKASLFKQGILSIQTGWRKRWKERFFVLSGPKLSWYESEANATAPGGSKPIASLVFSGKAATGLTRITLNPPKLYTKGIDKNVLDRLILIETNLDEATMALPWPPVENDDDEDNNTNDNTINNDNGNDPNTSTTAEDNENNTSSTTASSSKSKKVNLNNCLLVLANTVEEAKEWQTNFLTATTDPLQGDSTVTRVEDDEEEEQSNDDDKTEGSVSFTEMSNGNEKISNETTSVTTTTTANSSTVHTSASNPTVSTDLDSYNDTKVTEPIESESEKQQRLLQELQQHAKALVMSSAASSSSSTGTSTNKSSSTPSNGPSTLPANVQVPPGGKVIMVNGKPIIKPPPKTEKNVVSTVSSDGRATGETSYESTIRVQDAKAKFGSTVSSGTNGATPNLNRRNSKDSMMDTLSVVKDEIEEQRLRQGDRSIYEAGGTGRRGDRRFDDRDDDLSVSEGYVKGVAGSLGVRKGEDNTPRGTGKRWTRNNSNPTNTNIISMNNLSSATDAQQPSSDQTITGVSSEVPDDEYADTNITVTSNGEEDDDNVRNTVEEEEKITTVHALLRSEDTEESTTIPLPNVPDESIATEAHHQHHNHPVHSSPKVDHHHQQLHSAQSTASPNESNTAALSPQDQPSHSVIEDNRSVAASSVFIPLPGTWKASAEAPERLHLRRRVYEYLLRRSTASTDPTQAAYLEHTLVPEIEEALYASCNGDRDAYLDGATLKNRLKMVFAQRTANNSNTNGSNEGYNENSNPTKHTEKGTSSVPATPMVDKTVGSMTENNTPHTDQYSRREEQGGPSTVAKVPVDTVEASVVFSPDNNNTNIMASPQSPRGGRTMRHRQHNVVVPIDESTTTEAVRKEDITASVSSSVTKSRSSKNTKPRYPEENDDNDDEKGDGKANQSKEPYSAKKMSSPVPRPSGSLVPQPATPQQSPRWGNVPHPGDLPIRHYPALDPGGVLIKLVVERRADEPSPLPVLNKWQNRSCAECGITQTTGMFGVKATYCWYTELLFCPNCMSGKDGKSFLRPLPWRIVQELDDTPYPVSRAAAEYIDSVWEMPIIALTAVAPRTLGRNSNLRKIAALRGRIADLRETIVRRAAGMDYNGHTTNNSLLTPQKYTDDESTKLNKEQDSTLLSEQLPPIKVIAEASPNAGAALAQCTNILRNTLGNGLFFMGEVPELLPLSLIVPAASTVGNTRIIPKLDITQKLLSELFDAIEVEINQTNDKGTATNTSSTGSKKKSSSNNGESNNLHVRINTPETKTNPPKDLYKDRSHLPPHLRYAGRTPGPNRQPVKRSTDNNDDEEEYENDDDYADEEENEEEEYYDDNEEEEEEEEEVVVSPSGRRSGRSIQQQSSSTPRNTKPNSTNTGNNNYNNRTPSSSTKRSNPSSSTKR